MVKFTSIDVSAHFTARGVGGAAAWHPDIGEALKTLPAGQQTFWGIPFALGAAEEDSGRWLVLDREPQVVKIAAQARYVVVAHFCNISPLPADPDALKLTVLRVIPQPGEHLADYVLVYADGSEHRQPIRRRFEINEAVTNWGQNAFAARPHQQPIPLGFRGPIPPGAWGGFQTGVGSSSHEPASYWLYALENPYPDKVIRAIRLEPTGADCLAVAAITLYEGQEHPLRRRRLESLRVTLPAEMTLDGAETEVDLGTIARKYAVPAFVPEEWLGAPVVGWGEEPTPLEPTRQVILDVTASADATLQVAERAVPLAPVFQDGAAQSDDGQVLVEFLTPRKTWVHVTVEDGSTGRPTPVRAHFRAPDGRYLPPYGHRHEVNDQWFEDYGADLKLGHTQYAYVDGTFQIELPVGEVYVELSKGFEYQPVRQRVTIAPGQRELKLRIERPLNLRAAGWVTADTHVHFISPQTAWLEAQGEGVNLVNLLASQWGDLFTNVGDLTGDLSGVSRDDTLIWVGTENRQHLLGHISLLGTKGSPVFPMCASGPDESYLGDPTWTGLSEWADRCREQEGLVVIPHFPYPYAEVVSNLILDKVDGIELSAFGPQTDTLDTLQTQEWYRFLNCGYRVATVGGTDKMWAGMPVGGVRTYADLRGEEFTFENWARAVRAGRTFTTTGPIVGLTVEGKVVGDEIRLPAGGGTLGVEARAESVLPFHTLEIVVNGRVAAAETCESGTRQLTVKANLRLDGSAWLAARCVGRHTLWQGRPTLLGAHTSPVYVVAGDEVQFSPSDATFMMTMLDGGMTWLDTLSIPADPQRQARIRAVFQQAKEALHQRLHAAGYGHGH
jgi:hypothetical protein